MCGMGGIDLNLAIWEHWIFRTERCSDGVPYGTITLYLYRFRLVNHTRVALYS